MSGRRVHESEIGPGFRFYKSLIAEIAARHRLNPATIAAIVWQESDFQADAFRFEPKFWNRYMKPQPRFASLNPRRVSSSYGLMQIMYPLVFEDAIAENDVLPPEHLFEPVANLNVGCAHFRKLVLWAEGKTNDPELVRLAALASYNGGRGGNDPSKDNPLRNAAYAREVLARKYIMERQYGRA